MPANRSPAIPYFCCRRKVLKLIHRACFVQNVPVANASPDDIKELLGGALFKALYKWMTESGPVYLLPTGGGCACVFLTGAWVAAPQTVARK